MAQPPGDGGAPCQVCGHANRAGAKFCSNCGAKLALACPRCGSEVGSDDRFCDTCGYQLHGAPAAAPVLDTAAPQANGAAAPRGDERRWATVLFADLSNFTSLSEHMDPEDVKLLASRCTAQFSAEVTRLGGTVLQLIGDEIFAVFGAPAAHEDDAERGVRAALAIRDLPLTAPDGRRLQAHVGVNTGEVLAGIAGPDAGRDYTVYGDTVNTAARLRSAATMGTVLVGQETHRATRHTVRYRAVPPVAAKGKELPVPAWEALDVAPAPEARPLGTAPLIGRDDELTLLRGTWAKVVRERQPHLVTVVGEPGIGKSRLVAEFERGVLGENALVLHGRCLPYGEALGYWALAAALKQAAGILPEDTPEAAREKLTRCVEDALGVDPPEAAETALALALLAGIDLAADRAAPAPDVRTLQAAARRFLEALARSRPVCWMVEDLQWADAALLDLIEFVAARSHDAPLLIVGQARPELLDARPQWGRGVRSFTSLSLAPLSAAEAGALAAALEAELGLPQGAAEHIGRGSGGNPLFAEELAAMSAERGDAAGIPSAIKALISARIDGLPPEGRRTLHLAAVLGKAFWDGGLAALGASANVADQLEALADRDFLREQPRSQFAGVREFHFKHDLIRDVAYETLPRGERRALHGLAADWLEHAAAGRIDEHLSLLAHHTVEAGQPERALEYLERAAERASRAAAHREAAARLEQAMALAAQLERPAQVADLRAQRGAVLVRLAQYADARAELETALEGLPSQAAERRRSALDDLAVACNFLFDTAAARRYATEALALAKERGETDLFALSAIANADGSEEAGPLPLGQLERLIAEAGARGVSPPSLALYTHSIYLYWLGRSGEALGPSEAAVEVARATNDAGATMMSLPHRGLALVGQGRYAEAARAFDEALRFGREYGVDQWLARAIAMSATVPTDLHDYAAAESLAHEALELARSANFPPTEASATIDLIFVFARTGQVAAAEPLVARIAEIVERTRGWHGWLWRMRFAAAQAELALARGEWEAALEHADHAVARSRVKGRIKYETLGLTARGRALAALGRRADALGALGQAADLARPTGDPSMFLRAATALLDVDGNDALEGEARTAAQRIAAASPGDAARERFLAADPVHTLFRGALV